MTPKCLLLVLFSAVKKKILLLAINLEIKIQFGKICSF